MRPDPVVEELVRLASLRVDELAQIVEKKGEVEMLPDPENFCRSFHPDKPHFYCTEPKGHQSVHQNPWAKWDNFIMQPNPNRTAPAPLLQMVAQAREIVKQDLFVQQRKKHLLSLGYRESSSYFKQAMKAESERPIVDTDWD